MNNTIKVIETKISTPFGDLRKKSTYTPTPINVSGGIYFTDREKVRNDLIIEELLSLYTAGQTYGDIIVDGTEIGFDILFEFKDMNGNEILPQNMNLPLLYNIMYNEVMDLSRTDFCTYEIKIEYFLDERAVNIEDEAEKESNYLPTLGKCNLKRENACAYCKYHACYLSPKQMIRRECLKKGCHHFRKEEHPFWKNQGIELLKNKNEE